MPDSNLRLKAPILHVQASVGECYYHILTSGGRVDVANAAPGGEYSRREILCYPNIFCKGLIMFLLRGVDK